ncbi:hypothetical protein ACQPZ8_26610 [Actinomadura nitritigenes]
MPVFAVQADGSEVTTIEGRSSPDGGLSHKAVRAAARPPAPEKD